MKLGCILQRLFSTFPYSWPGVGLLLLRTCVGARVAHLAIVEMSTKAWEPAAIVQSVIALAASISLFAGFWTPVMGAIIAFDEVWIALSQASLQQERTWIHILMALLAVSVAMLGPGAWSIDARLFGRKRIDIDGARARRASLEMGKSALDDRGTSSRSM